MRPSLTYNIAFAKISLQLCNDYPGWVIEHNDTLYEQHSIQI